MLPKAGISNAKSLAEHNLKDSSNFQKAGDVYLRANHAQRISLPVFFNTPRRTEDIISKKRFNDYNQSIIEKSHSGRTMCLIDSYNRLAASSRARDYAMLSEACNRAGKPRDEGRAYYSRGVLLDNLGKYQEAIKEYSKFMALCREIGDTHGEALSYNRIGVDYMKIGDTTNIESNYKRSLLYHEKHKNIADVAGKFLAHINLGIVYNILGEYEQASINH